MTASATMAPWQQAESEVLHFLKLLGKNPHHTYFRTIRPKGGANWNRKGADLDGFHVTDLAIDNDGGESVYAVIGNATGATGINEKGEPTGAVCDQDCPTIPALFVEWDDQPIEWQVTAWKELGLPEPTLMVDTGGKSTHVYFVLTEPLDAAIWKPLQKRLIAYCKGDRRCKNPSRVMRLPGFRYVDKTTGKVTDNYAQIVHESGHRYTVADIEACLPPEQPKVQLVQVPTPISKVVPLQRSADAPALVDLLSRENLKTWKQGVGEGERNDTTFVLAAALMALEQAATAEGLPYTGTAEEAIRDFTGRCSPPLEDSEVDRTINSARSQPRTVDPGWPKRLDFQRRRLQRHTSSTAKASNRRSPAAEPAEVLASFLDLIDSLPSGWQSAGGGDLRQSNLAPGPLSLMLPADLFRFNELELMAEVHTSKGWQQITESDLDSAYVVLSQKGWKIALEPVTKAVLHVARQNTFHPIRNYLEGLEQRSDLAPFDLDQVAPQFFRATAPLHVAMVRKWLIGAVGRVLDPGIQMDAALVLQGKQGIRKSRTFEELASGPWYCSTVPDQDKDFLLNVHSCWIFELAELESVTTKRESGHLKNLISTSSDRVRLPYGRSAERRPRSSVFAGTVNRNDFLRDQTGNRRYWVVPIEGEKVLDTEALKAARDGIWKAAVLAWRKGELPMLPTDMANQSEQQNAEFVEVDPWADLVAEFLAAREHPDFYPVLMTDLLNHLGVEKGFQTNLLARRVRDLASQLGWEHARRRKKGVGRKEGLWFTGHPGHLSATPPGHLSQPSDTNGSDLVATPATSLSKKEETSYKKRDEDAKDVSPLTPRGVAGVATPSTRSKPIAPQSISVATPPEKRGGREVAGVATPSDPFVGTSRIGRVHCTYEQLVAAFGPPQRSIAAGDKLDRISVEWELQTSAGLLTIYDRSSWEGGRTIKKRAIFWEIGGTANEHTDQALHPVVALVRDQLEKNGGQILVTA